MCTNLILDNLSGLQWPLCVYDSEMCSPPIIPTGIGRASHVLSLSMVLWLAVSHEGKCWGDHHGLGHRWMIQLQRDSDCIPENCLSSDMHRTNPKSLENCTVGRQCYCQIPDGGTWKWWRHLMVCFVLKWIQILDLSVSLFFVVGWLLLSWEFFFSHCVIFSFFFLFLHCHSCFLFGIIYYTLLRPQIRGSWSSVRLSKEPWFSCSIWRRGLFAGCVVRM